MNDYGLAGLLSFGLAGVFLAASLVIFMLFVPMLRRLQGSTEEHGRRQRADQNN